MVERIVKGKDRLRRALMLILLTLAIFKHELFSVKPIHNLIESGLGPLAQLADVALLIVVILSFSFLEYITDYCFDEIKLFRNISMGNDKIEYAWVDVVWKDRVLQLGAFMYIRYEVGNFVVEGVEYDRSGMVVGNFKTVVSKYENRELNFIYKASSRDEDHEHGGRGIYTFFGKKCVEYWGEYIDDHKSECFGVRGARLRFIIGDLADEDLQGVRPKVLSYHKKNIIAALRRFFVPAPELTPQEQSVITTAAMNYYASLGGSGCHQPPQA